MDKAATETAERVRQYIETVRGQLSNAGDAVPTARWCSWVHRCCERLGPLWGGPDVLAWWLAERTQPQRHTMTRARRDKLIRLSGRDQRTFDCLVMYDVGAYTPDRHRGGWDGMRVTHYLTLRLQLNGPVTQ